MLTFAALCEVCAEVGFFPAMQLPQLQPHPLVKQAGARHAIFLLSIHPTTCIHGLQEGEGYILQLLHLTTILILTELRYAWLASPSQKIKVADVTIGNNAQLTYSDIGVSCTAQLTCTICAAHASALPGSLVSLCMPCVHLQLLQPHL